MWGESLRTHRVEAYFVSTMGRAEDPTSFLHSSVQGEPHPALFRGQGPPVLERECDAYGEETSEVTYLGGEGRVQNGESVLCIACGSEG